ncbi:hypothetical protein F5884DRAFT_98465 [Xylogone sp. PMI_703]|nr:hypothetical protein F5884DRAFT_98465 [Xylogone sp. PMI_703]
MEGVGEDVMMDDVESRAEQQKSTRGHVISSTTIKAPPYSYACLELTTQVSKNIILDELTVRTYITAALTRYLGLTGSAISIDILKVDGKECWIRMPREDLSPVIAAVGGWVGTNGADGQVGWRVRASGNWLGILIGNRAAEEIWKY